MVKRKKLLHILSDKKFFNKINRFDDEIFCNKTIFIEEGESNFNFSIEIDVFKSTKENILPIVEIAKLHDAIIVYCLDYFKMKIINSLPKNMKIYWVFFGAELYNHRLDLMLSESTQAHYLNQHQNNRKGISRWIIQKMYDFKSKINYHICIKRISYIFLQSENEFDFIKKYWNVPPFAMFPIDNIHLTNSVTSIKKDLVIVGNSRSAFNNHFEIIEIVKKNKQPNAYKCILFFNYGKVNDYSKGVENEVNKCSNFEIIEEFLKKEDFYSFYQNASALVINSYRQLAMHNIFTAIKFGCKIYLSDHNVIKDWLIKNELLIFSIQDFEIDYLTNNLSLSDDQIKHNCSKLNDLINYFDYKTFNENFQKSLF